MGELTTLFTNSFSMENFGLSHRCSIFLIAYIFVMFVMTQVLSADAWTVCESEIDPGLPCSEETIPFCSFQCQKKFGKRYITTECVEKTPGEPMCICVYKNQTCPPPKIQ
ncbi:uncharacterized protein LOC132611204 [Lycium barbarum]|uniref:uncharacterized protein LOC132611204 n=1 Tax=Lycium barbarum TaxID=112863 RepID=UPI00293E0B5B|nr:uncharacterized protein LOC132611204 [Lycium barbarum]